MSKQVIRKRLLTGPALYGKVPAHGDFISRGLERGQISEIDSWLTHWLELTKQKWGDSFDDNYRVSQPWLFSGRNLTAILMPSFDKVERLFPLFAVVGASARMQKLYDIVFSVIADHRSGDQLFEDLKGMKCGDVNLDSEGWYLPDANEVSMPHPFFGDDTEWVKGAVR